MEFGVQFFPNVTPEEKSGMQYFGECLNLCDLLDKCRGRLRIVFSARTRSFGLTDRNQDPHATIEMDLSEPAVQTIGIVAV